MCIRDRIESRAFAECSSLASVTFGENSALTYIGGSAFTECSGLTGITIPDRVTKIEEDTFYECTSLTAVKVGRSVYEISSGAFQNCINLSEVEFPMGAPGEVHVTSFLNIAVGARAVVLPEYSASFGTLESNLFNFTPVWNNLVVADGEEAPAPCTLEQLQPLAAGDPVLRKDPDGSFRLSFGLQKSTDLETFVPLDLSGLNPTINEQGKIELRLISIEDTAFFRLQFGN